jgi:hypothetical protein
LTSEEMGCTALVKDFFVVTGEELRGAAFVEDLFAGATGKNVSGACADFV